MKNKKAFHLELSSESSGISDAHFKMSGDTGELLLALVGVMKCSPEFRAMIFTVAKNYEQVSKQIDTGIITNFNAN